MSENTEDQAEPNTSETATPDLAEQQAQAFFQGLADAEYDTAFSLLAEDVQLELVENAESITSLIEPEPERILAECWRAMTNLYGPFESIGSIDSDVSDEEAVASVTLECENKTLQFDVPVDASGTIMDWPFVGDYEPPDYVNASQIAEREMAVETDDVTLGGTLTVPTDAESVPGVVLVHGAGATDRDYSSGANKILKDVAWGLAKHGIGSLRYDKRSFVEEIPAEEVDFETVVIGDTVTAIDTLKTAPEIDSNHLFVVGHSLGGTLSPYIASQHDNVSGIINLDGSCIGTSPTSKIEAHRDHWEHRDKNSSYGHAQLDQMRETANRIESGDADPDETLLGQSAAWAQHYSEYTTDWVSTTHSLSIPFLIAKTGRFAPEVATDEVESLRAELPGDNIQINFYDDLNHYLQRGAVPDSIYESANFRKPPAEGIIDDIAKFVFEAVESNP